MMNDELMKLEKEHIMQTYVRADVVFEYGDGCYLYDSEGKKYLDFVGGVAVCVIGHANKEVADAIYRQSRKLVTVSDLYYTKPQVLLAKKLAELSGLKKSFFCHSGAEANEAAIKLAKKVTGKKHFIAFEGAFHGRTTGALALTWKKELREPFLPLAPDVTFVKFDDTDALAQAITKETAGVFIEPIQGESGVIVPHHGFLKQVRKICNEYSILMIVDEVQTGMGRTGKFFAYQHEDIKPDIATLAKGLGNGIPIGVCLSNYELEAGEHGSTLSGNPVAAAAALATIEYIEKHNLIKNALVAGDYLIAQLETLKNKTAMVAGVRGKGLIIGLMIKEKKAAGIVDKCLKLGLVCNAPAPDTIRFLPPLTATKAQVDEAVDILIEAMK